MKVLLYNFSVPGDGNPAAGGVGVYLASLSRALTDRGAEVFFLSSGHDYSPWTKKPYISYAGKHPLRRAKIINSPVIAPAHETFFSPELYLESPALDAMPARLRQRFGDLDVLHFHNIEGLTAGFFRAARKTFPTAKIILSAHNYNLVCPQVNLWKQDRAACNDYEDGYACASCIPFRTATFKKRVRAAWWLRDKTALLPASVTTALARRRGLPLGEEIHLPVELTNGMPVLATAALAQAYRNLRATNIALADTVFDHVLAVSERTRAVLLAHGVQHHNLTTSYIGSIHVADHVSARRRDAAGATLHIAYLGYARRDKGFNFFLSALEALPGAMAARLTVTIAAKLGEDTRVISRIGRLGRKLNVNLMNGYDSKRLPELLKSVDLGIVPPLWEDNLPQVAIEFVANGIPILTSDAGGASEIAANPNFMFAAASRASFTEALRRIVDREVPLEDFWRRAPNIRNFAAHLDDLLPLYQPRSTGSAMPRAEQRPPAAPQA